MSWSRSQQRHTRRPPPISVLSHLPSQSVPHTPFTQHRPFSHRRVPALHHSSLPSAHRPPSSGAWASSRLTLMFTLSLPSLPRPVSPWLMSALDPPRPLFLSLHHGASYSLFFFPVFSSSLVYRMQHFIVCLFMFLSSFFFFIAVTQPPFLFPCFTVFSVLSLTSHHLTFFYRFFFPFFFLPLLLSLFFFFFVSSLRYLILHFHSHASLFSFLLFLLSVISSMYHLFFISFSLFTSFISSLWYLISLLHLPFLTLLSHLSVINIKGKVKTEYVHPLPASCPSRTPQHSQGRRVFWLLRRTRIHHLESAGRPSSQVVKDIAESLKDASNQVKYGGGCVSCRKR